MYPSPLRDGGYDIADFFDDPSRLRHRRRLPRLRRGRPPARHPRDRRPRHEPHLDRPPVVPGGALEPATARSATGTSGRTPPRATRTRGSSSSTPRRRTGPGTTRRGAVLLAPLLLPPARPQLRQPRGPGGDARRAALLARPRARRLPPRRRALPVRARRHELREPARDARLPQARARRDRRRTTPTACCSPRPTSGRRTSSSTSATATSATWRSTSRSCRACSWRCGARRRRRSTRSSSRRRAIPDNCQWGLFLRNHDELTLEMVTDEERDYMYAEYAKDPRMKLNLGIRRRLAPLLDNGRDEIELMHAILFSLPGSPVLYYGDEIGMGDNVYLGDRDGVRTPMQWTGDRNGGFSRADFAQLYAAAADGPGLRLPGGQRRGAAAHADVAAALDAPLHRAAQGAPGVRARQLRAAASRRTRASSPTSAATRTTSCSACTTSRARRRRSSSTCRRFEGRARARCSAARASRASASCRTC